MRYPIIVSLAGRPTEFPLPLVLQSVSAIIHLLGSDTVMPLFAMHLQDLFISASLIILVTKFMPIGIRDQLSLADHGAPFQDIAPRKLRSSAPMTILERLIRPDPDGLRLRNSRWSLNAGSSPSPSSYDDKRDGTQSYCG